MKKILVMSAALSLVLWACGDDSSSTGPELSSASGIAESSSAVVPESSGANPESSEAGPESSTTAESSSSANDDVPCQVVDNMGGSCQDDNSTEDPMLDGASGGDQALPPVAIMAVENDSATYLVQNVRMPCEEIGGFAGMTRRLLKPTLEVTMDETEMHVKPVVETATSSSDCTCTSQFAFKIKLVSPFDQATLLVIDDRINQGNRMRIVTK